MEIKSPIARVGCTAEELFDFASKLENLESLLPEDQVQSFQLNGDVCKFKVKGGFDVVIKKTSEQRPKFIQFNSQQGTPIRFGLEVRIEASDTGTEVQVVCDTELNPFMRIMAEKPLQNIFDGMVEKIVNRFPLN
ncbi:MAG: hypothetical protein OSA78_04745 [Flavobacteriales bacterium]|nr:hypothetical protein [Flavobacteriales bacterium]